jgi:hypothetical protein
MRSDDLYNLGAFMIVKIKKKVNNIKKYFVKENFSTSRTIIADKKY